MYVAGVEERTVQVEVEAWFANTVTDEGEQLTVRADEETVSESVTLPEKPPWLVRVTEKVPCAPD